MNKKHFLILTIFVLSTNFVLANVQSPIYTDDIGRSHFLGKGGYSTLHQYKMGEDYNKVINKTVDELSKEQGKKITNNEQPTNYETDITKVIKEKPVVPAASHKSTFSSEKGKIDVSSHYGIGGTNIPAGVNNSKTIYTDDLGRLHFFGKANLIKE